MIKANSQEEIQRLEEYLENVKVDQDLFWWIQKEPVDRCVERSDRQAQYIEKNEEIIGVCLTWARSRVLGPREACVRTLVVSSSHRGEGYGRQLIEGAESFAEEQGMSVMIAEVLQSSPHHDWWELQNYEEQDRRYTSGGRGMVVYEKELDPVFKTEDPLEF